MKGIPKAQKVSVSSSKSCKRGSSEASNKLKSCLILWTSNLKKFKKWRSRFC